MRNNKECSLLKFIGALIAILLLLGCQLPPEKRTANKEMEEVLQEASDDNALIRKRSTTSLPDEVQKAFAPTLSETKGKDMANAEKRFDLVADQVPARSFFLSLVEDTPYNITVHPNVDGKISLQLKKVTVREVLETVRNVYGFDYRQTTQGIEILPATLQTRAFSVNYLDITRSGDSETQVSAGTLKSSSTNGSGTSNPTTGTGTTTTTSGSSDQSDQTAINSRISTTSKADFWQELKTAIQTIVGTGDGRTVAVSPLASLVVVQAMPDELKKVEDFLKSAELSLNRQVILEAKIIEVDLNDSFQAGINWALVSGRLNATQYGGQTISSQITSDGTFPVLNSALPSPLDINPNQPKVNAASNTQSYGGVFALSTNFKNLGTFIELLGAQGKVHVLSSPRVSTINNQKALIKIGFDRFFITNVSTTTTSSTSTSQTTPNVTFDSFFSGIALDVTPHITDTDEVTLHIHPTISDVEDDIKNFTLNGQAQSYPLAKSSVRESDNMVRARNGEMVIIGGLMQNQNSELTQGIPILKDLPLLGNIFKHTVQVSTKSELVILLRPIIVGEGTWSEQMDNDLAQFQKVHEGIDKDD